MPPSFIYSPLVHSSPPFLNRIFSIRTCVAALFEHPTSPRILLRVLSSAHNCLCPYIFSLYLFSHVSMLYPYLFGLLSFLLCIPLFTILSGLLLNPASPSLNILSIGISAPLHLSQANWRSFIRQGFILLSVYKEMPLLSCKATSWAGLICGLAICCLVCAPTGYSTSNSQDG